MDTQTPSHSVPIGTYVVPVAKSIVIPLAADAWRSVPGFTVVGIIREHVISASSKPLVLIAIYGNPDELCPSTRFEYESDVREYDPFFDGINIHKSLR